MQVVVFEDAGWRDLLPLTAARAAFELRCGCDTLIDKYRAIFGADAVAVLARIELSDVVGERCRAWSGGPCDLLVNGRLLPWEQADSTAAHRSLTVATRLIPCPSACWLSDVLVAARLDETARRRLTPEAVRDAVTLRGVLADLPRIEFEPRWGRLIRYPWDLIAANGDELARQISAMPAGHHGRVDVGAHLLNPDAIRIGTGSRVKPTAVLDAESGPIHIGANVTISPHVYVRGPCSIGDGSLIQPGASIRENTSIGPVCKIGGEVEGSIIQAHSNKQHDGFLGHSYVGEWVNLGADTVTSDLKNTYGSVSVALHGGDAIDTGQRFVGSIIGDHTKTAICTRLNTGTVLGFCCQIATARPPRYVADYTWLTDDAAQTYDVEKAIATARTVMLRRKVPLSPAMEMLMRQIAQQRTT